ncbi:MAG: hypothetical protein EZS28_037205 [Streblomastix strix]|uniref:HNH nuclease domain-containing protein n=1 Tax=Streblomastix strix TaxID=222440 RepID=A0A5J4UA44_9EUKA|nr:MAG: hypothetical protein EZS28_037205 [Streblomastix strix]
MAEENTWQTLTGYDDYEILAEEPHTIRKKSDKSIPSMHIGYGKWMIILNYNIEPYDRVLANHFISNHRKSYYVRHKNKNDLDNRIDNLYWVQDITQQPAIYESSKDQAKPEAKPVLKEQTIQNISDLTEPPEFKQQIIQADGSSLETEGLSEAKEASQRLVIKIQLMQIHLQA